LRLIKADKVNGVIALELSADMFRAIIDSVDNIVLKQQRTLLENLPAEDQVRQKLDEYMALKDDLQKIWEKFLQ
jgi:3-methyladenine DNA glycosylase/8-oxoguanine DNA glycosylase